MKLIQRDYYLNRLYAVKDVPDIKVITGVRRSGKSKLMDSFIGMISADSVNIVLIKLNLKKFERLLNPDTLYEYIEEKYDPQKDNYLFVDEIQLCEGFERVINSIHEEELYNIFLTGSNAFLLSSDLATLFVGRTYELQLFPFSFKEYLAYFPNENIYAALSQYITEGGMAGSYLYKNTTQKYRYINNEVLNALIVRDIINKNRLQNEPLLHALIDYLMDNIGNLTSVRTFTNTLSSNNTKADHKTIGKYIDLLCKAFAFYKIRRYDIKGKKYLRSEDKYYLCDQSFRFARLGTKNMDYGRVLENIVAIELLRRGYEVYVGVLYKKEIDFVVMKQGEKMYIQVANDISDKETFKREVSPLLQIRDAYPKRLIARTYQPRYQHEGIEVIDAAEWLNQ
jgi:predicted AAA+ superfamily ATPase